MGTISTHEELYAAFEALNSEGGWHRKLPALWPEPKESFLPWQWRYHEIKPVLDAAGELVSTEHAERRNLTLRNPKPGNPYATVNTLVAAYQMIKPGEVARSHRHTPNALRLILDGVGTYTTVDGTRVEMCPGDVLLTPSWCWHSHESLSDTPCYWMDFLDVPLVHLLEPMFFERHPNGLEPNPITVETSPIAFRWADSRAALKNAEYRATHYADHFVELGNPALETIGLAMLQFKAGGESRALKTTANGIFAVISGDGYTEIDGQRFEWSRGDTLAIPSWRTYQHHCSSDAVMLWVNDSPVMKKFDWYRTQLSNVSEA